MFQITKATNSSIEDLAKEHWEGLFRRKLVFSRGTLPYERDSIVRRIESIRKVSRGKQLVFINDLTNNDYALLKKIVMGKPDELNRIGAEILRKIFSYIYPQITYRDKKKDKKKFGDYLLDIFNYDLFVDKARYWNAYEVTKKLGVDVCIYCNRNYTYTLSKGREYHARPEFDHFLPKSEYPFFAISFYNLIPSCHTCNSNLKRDINFNTVSYLHPYLSSLDNAVRFTVEFTKKQNFSAKDIQKKFGVMFFMDKIDNFKLKLIKKDSKVPDRLYTKARSNINVFKLEEFYNCHKDLVTEMVLNTIVYSEAKIKDLMKDFGGILFNSRDDVIRHITKNYPNDGDMPKRPFSKLVKDIHQEFGLKY